MNPTLTVNEYETLAKDICPDCLGAYLHDLPPDPPGEASIICARCGAKFGPQSTGMNAFSVFRLKGPEKLLLDRMELRKALEPVCSCLAERIMHITKDVEAGASPPPVTAYFTVEDAQALLAIFKLVA